MAVPRKEKAYEKYAWIIFFALGIVFLVQAAVSIVTGRPLDAFVQGSIGMSWTQLVTAQPRIAGFISHLSTSNGIIAAVADVSVIAISFRSYRRGEKWAWYTFLAVPILFGLATIITTPDNLLFAIIAAVGLLLPYRKFFPKK
ncbi:MAG: hypothetical protein LYZ66_05355 [Nitrososphaerales archaeon]|nr:hypothetical protein [Nitrososphaerales archaeon]